MHNFEQLLADVLEATTKKRTTPEAAETDFSLACDQLIFALRDKAGEMQKVLTSRTVDLDETAILDGNLNMELVRDIVTDCTAKNVRHLPPAQAQTLIDFVPLGTDAISILAFACGRGKHPAQFESYRDNVIMAASLMSRYPSEVSANTKGLMARNLPDCMADGDIKADVRESWFRILVEGIQSDDYDFQMIQKLHSCPAWRHITVFAEVVFDLQAACYRQVWQRVCGDSTEIPAETNERLRAKLLISMIEHLH